MKAIVILLLCSFILHFCKADEKPELKFVGSLKEFERDYHENEGNKISDCITILRDTINLKNITLLGSQNIYEEDGSLKEIRTIELSIPEFENTVSFDEEIYSELESAVEANQIVGLNLELFVHGLAEERADEKYMSKKLEVYEFTELIRSSRRIVKTEHLKDLNQLEEHYKFQFDCEKCKPTLTSRIAFDQNNKIIPSKSSIIPELYASILKCEGTPSEEVIETAYYSFVNAVLEAEDMDDVPETLRDSLQQKFPNMSFLVTTEPFEGYYMSTDFNIEMVYDDDGIGNYASLAIYNFNNL